MSSKGKREKSANDMSWTFASTYVLQKSIYSSLSRSLSFSFFSRVCFFFLALLFRLFLVLRRRRSTILEPQCFLSIPCLLYCFVRVMREEEGDDGGTTQWCEMLMYVCAQIDYIFYLSTMMMRTTTTTSKRRRKTRDKTRSRAHSSSLASYYCRST